MEKLLQKTDPYIVRFAITGPESTGKSALAEYLAKHFDTVFVPEFARKYLQMIDREYDYDDLEYIAKKQMLTENYLQKKAHGFLFCDTDLTVIKIWSEHRYQKCSDWVNYYQPRIKYELYLLCDIDLPWEADPLREHPNMRQHFFDLYHQNLIDRQVKFAVISGSGQERYDNALIAIETLVRKNFNIF